MRVHGKYSGLWTLPLHLKWLVSEGTVKSPYMHDWLTHGLAERQTDTRRHDLVIDLVIDRISSHNIRIHMFNTYRILLRLIRRATH
jgi:hypothetical protein